MRSERPKRTEPTPCDARNCHHCRLEGRVRPLSPADLAWYWNDGEADLGARSTHGAFVDMANSGIQGGGKTNGVENQAVERRRLDATARHRCIRQRLHRAPAAAIATLRVAYGAANWTACHSQVEIRRGVQPNPLTAPEVYAAAADTYRAEILRLAPLTPIALAFERRRQAASAPPPKPAKSQVVPTGEPVDARAALTALFARDPLLARSARGIVLMAACGVCPGCNGHQCAIAEAIGSQAAAMLEEAHQLAGVGKPQASRRSVRRSYLIEVPDAG